MISRRRLVQSIGATATVIGLAGCSGTNATSTTEESSPDTESSGDTPSANQKFQDFTNEDSVTIDVGGADGLSFQPSEILISTGTTVTWKWTSQGVEHNVIQTEGIFKSHEDGGTTGEAGHTFSYTFDRTGTYDYECTPHQEVGMVGTVRVE